MRVAIVHDWLYVSGGAELVLSEMLKCYPGADVFTLFDFLDRKDREKLGIGATKTSFLQKIPGMRRAHRMFLPLMPYAIEQFDFADYDLVISSSYAVAMGIITGPNQVHVAYVHSPMRYAWDLQETYLSHSKFSALKNFAARYFLHKLRIWDTRTANGPDILIANSKFVARRIKKTYGRIAEVINPPVYLADSRPPVAKGDHFFVASRLVPYKNIETIVRAFAKAPDLKLIVAGHGPQFEMLSRIATPNVTMKGFVSTAELRDLMASARAFVFAAEEDFGIVPVEAMAEGTPVIAYGRGGCLETVVDGQTGMFFHEQTPEAVLAAIRRFTEREGAISPEACRSHAEKFADSRFRAELIDAVDRTMAEVAASRGIAAHNPNEATAKAQTLETLP